MKTVYIDVTDIITWRGNFSGIQRVVYEVGLRLAKNKKHNVGYVYYNDKARSFYKIDANVFEEMRKAREQQLAHTQHINNGDSLRSSTREFAKRVYRSMPGSVAGTAKKSYNYTRHQAGRFMNGFVRPAVRFVKTKYPTREYVPPMFQERLQPLEITKQDTFLILGQGWYGPKWYRPTMFLELAKLKAKKEFDVAVLIHDTIPVSHPQFFDRGFPHVYTEFLFETLIMAKTVFAISQSTRSDVEKFCEDNAIPMPNIVTIREGDSFTPDSNPVRPYGVYDNEKYVLAVGSFEIRKNYRVLYEAVKEAQLRNVTIPKIIIVGRQGFLSYDLARLIEDDPTTQASILHFRHVDDAELTWLYQHALFTVYPSSYEGWGLPIAEALSYGKFCISSNTSSMPEVGGKLVDYVSPYDVVGWMEKLSLYGSDSELLAQKTAAVEKNFKPHSWSEATQAIEAAL